MKIYISGPITGIPDENRESFRLAAMILRSNGHEAINPHELDHIEGATWLDFMRRDIVEMMACDAVTTLPGWENSRGALTEIGLCERLGIPVYDIVTFWRPNETASV